MKRMARSVAFVLVVIPAAGGLTRASAGILEAAKKGDLPAVQQAIANGEDKNTRSGRPFFTFGASGFDKDGALSYSQDAEWTPLIHAAFNGHEPVVRYLLGVGADANAVDFNGITALMYAINANNTKVVDAIAAAKAALDYGEPSLGMTPLMWAAIHGKDSTFHALLSRGPNLEQKDKDGWSALHYVARRGRTACVGPLLKSGATPDAVDNEERTPLMIAAENGNADIVKQLLQSGATKTLKSKEGKTALEYAERKSGLGGLKIDRIDDTTIRVTAGFVYQRHLILGYESPFRIKSVDRGVFQTDGLVPMGAQSAVGVTWVFNEPGMAFHNGDYVYTSLAKDASIKFTKEGAVLSHFKVANPNERGIGEVIAILRDRRDTGKDVQGPNAVSPARALSTAGAEAEDGPTQGKVIPLGIWVIGGTVLAIVLAFAIFRFRGTTMR